MSMVLLIAAGLAGLGGCLALALSQHRHWQAAMRSGSLPPRWARRLGWSLIAASLGLLIMRDGASFAMLFWPLLIGAGALLTAGLLSWKPTLLSPLSKWCTGRR